MEGLYSIHEGGIHPASTMETTMTGYTDLEITVLALIKMGTWIAPCVVVAWIVTEAIEFMKPWRI